MARLPDELSFIAAGGEFTHRSLLCPSTSTRQQSGGRKSPCLLPIRQEREQLLECALRS
jgi:hypothetical protein